MKYLIPLIVAALQSASLCGAENVSVAFDHAKLGFALNALAAQFGKEIEWDPKVAQDKQISINIKAKDFPDAFDQAGKQLGLSWEDKNGKVLIKPPGATAP